VHCADCSCTSATSTNTSSVCLCGDCFVAGVDVPEINHSSDHRYIVATCLEIPLFSKDWTVSEELALLDGTVITDDAWYSSRTDLISIRP